MIAPAAVYFFVFSYVPMPGIIMAFKRLNFTQGIFASPWVGLENFRFFFISGDAWFLTRNTILYNLAFMIVGTTMQVSVAVVLSEIGARVFKKVTQTMMFLPYFISMVVIGAFIYNIFNYEFGAFNTLLADLGLEKTNVYSNPGVWPAILITLNTWKGLGYGTVLYLAAIMGIDQEIYEAADIDGANVFQKVRVITLPGILPTIVTLTLLSVGGICRGNFQLFYNVVGSNGMLYKMTDVIDTYVYRALMGASDFGMSAAAGSYQSILNLTIILTVNGITRLIDKDYALF
ncbi:MAG: ABC transporter permease subunit [Oscillospiraceae bacterium]|nr:ABC transporter permease subunit [Oscillospiraceae bacterium]